ncbi:HPP family protein [Algicella marina]|uniref:CBS domain-containing protein n=1 Tax=Algicella marina TaxID=2683284 RepID=A0A6P1SYJ5_9RHOB|nr:HPP family protein [Algicella marina]QHQ34827.1 CBS domain-containing protein [Algicella marina]
MHFIRSFGPAVPRVSLSEAFRAGVGALTGLGVSGVFLLSPEIDVNTGLYLVAPFGASAVLLFAVPNSPLAQPWSAIVGNTVAAVIGIALSIVIADPVLRIPLAVGLSIMAMILCRAVHPPAGAVAMTAAMSPEAVDHLGFWFALTPVATGTAMLVALAMVYARLTQRTYPFRQFEAAGQSGREDRKPVERLGLSEGELTELLERYRQAFNLGVEDLARLIGAAELQAASHGMGPMVAEDFMSRDLITVRPDTRLAEVADLFRNHRFKSLPVVGPDAKFLGVIFQIHLISEARNDALRLERGFLSAFKRLLDRHREKPIRAGDIMSVAGPRATTQTPIAAFISLMADGTVDAIPVLKSGQVVGIVTQTDIVAAMARQIVRTE